MIEVPSITEDAMPEKFNAAKRGASRGRQRFAFVRQGAAVRVQFGRATLIELAAYAIDEEIRKLALGHLVAMSRGGELPGYSGRVAIPPSGEHADDPRAIVCVAIPDLDDSGDLFAVFQEEVESAA